MFYLQEDFGDISLIDRLESGYTEEIYGLFQKVYKHLQRSFCKGMGLGYDRCLTNTEFGRQQSGRSSLFQILF